MPGEKPSVSFEQENLWFIDFEAGIRSAEQYASSEIHLMARRNLYKYASPRLIKPKKSTEAIVDPKLLELESKTLDIERLMVESVGRTGFERILDVGAGNAIFDIWLHAKHGHRGEIVAFEQSEAIAEDAKKIIDEDWPDAPIKVAVGDVMDLTEHVEGNFDIIFAKYLLYHVSQPKRALEEIYQALKPGGVLIVSGRGIENMKRLWGFGPKIADYINQRALNEQRTKDGRPLPIYRASQSFYWHFNRNNAERYFPDYYEDLGPVIDTKTHKLSPYVYSGELRIPASARQEYGEAIYSLAPDFRPQEPPSDLFVDAIRDVVFPEFDQEVAQKGFFTDSYSDWFGRYRKHKYSRTRSKGQK